MFTSFGNMSLTVKPIFYPNYVGADMSATVAPSTFPCHFRWIQVAQILPPVAVGKSSGISGLSNLKRPWVDGAIGSGLPYAEVLGVIATTKISDTPNLSRSHTSTATPQVKFRFETACMCSARARRISSSAGSRGGFVFGNNPAGDRLLVGNADLVPTQFWKDGVAADFPTYPYVV